MSDGIVSPRHHAAAGAVHGGQMNTVEAALPRAVPGTFIGHPKGLFYLAFTEGWERFSYYGMTGLVVIYMVNQLLLPGHVEHIAGFAALRAVIERVFGPLSTQALASQIFGLYSGFVYFTPVLGGFVADRWIGQRNAVVIGALCMSGGHLAMTFDRSFLVALALLVIGSGFLKGNISAQVGALYPRDDEARLTRGFIIFSTAINIGAILGPLLCGFLAQAYGWHYGFGVAAIFMLCGLATYLYGYRTLPARVERASRADGALSSADRRIVGSLLVVMIVMTLPLIAFFQVFNVFPVWVQEHVALDVGRFRIPVPWFTSINSLASVASAPLLLWLWRHQAARGREPGALGKMALGAWITALSCMVLVAAIVVSRGSPIPAWWAVVYCAGLGLGFMYYWPTLLALVSRTAPVSVNATMVGITFMTLFLASMAIGWLGTMYERMSPTGFWLLHATIAAGGGLLVAIISRPLGSSLQAGAA